jgi:protein-tyrosine phosphatase
MSLHTGLYWVATSAQGNLAIAPRPRGGDWLEDEIAGWRAAGVDRVVSLLTPSESRDLELEAEPAMCGRYGIAFTNLPIEDRAIPASHRSALDLIDSIAGDLNRGFRVAVHCRQGIGRAALIAAAVLIEQGVGLSEAIDRVSRSRGIVVPETEEQREWLRRWAGSRSRAGVPGTRNATRVL